MRYGWLLLLLAPLICFGHSKVVTTEPIQGAQLENAPKIVTIRFNKTIEPHFNKAELLMNNAWTPLPSKVEARALIIHLDAKPQKNYRIRWSVISQDGHRQRGNLSFSVK